MLGTTMTTNELRKGARVHLRNGWQADVADNARGNIRMCKVYGFETEIGSVYAHDIMYVELGDGCLLPIAHTRAQLKLRQSLYAMGM